MTSEQEVDKITIDINDGESSIILADKNGKRLPNVQMQKNLLEYCLRTYKLLHKDFKKKFMESI